MLNKQQFLYFTIFLVVIVTMAACSNYFFRSNYNNANALLHDTKNMQTKPFLKAHMKNGDVIILRDSYEVDTLTDLVSGTGIQYDYNRRIIMEGKLTIPIDSVAIFETNTKIIDPEAGRIATLSILAGLDVAFGIFCITNPKACFGSCPTFYINENENFHFSDAEGFSNAISPSLEYGDIDALITAPFKGETFNITMKNEALETHCVNNVQLLAIPIETGEYVYQSPNNTFYLCENNYQLTKAEASEGNVLPLLQNFDRQERFSLADENNLNTREEIYLEFNTVKDINSLGLIIDFRQTLMTTYFIYSAIGYMGDMVGDIFAEFETDPDIRSKLNQGIKKELGNIDIYVWNEQNKNWELQDGFYETGPIAVNRQIIPIENVSQESTVKLKIILNKGLWRIDNLTLTNIKKEIQPHYLSPVSATNKGIVENSILPLFTNPEKYLISMPGSAYTFTFEMPDKNKNYMLFLYSEGYYLEWMREHWIQDKDLLKLKQMVEDPSKYLRTETKNYKIYENNLEADFWNSKINTKTFSYYEN